MRPLARAALLAFGIAVVLSAAWARSPLDAEPDDRALTHFATLASFYLAIGAISFVAPRAKVGGRWLALAVGVPVTVLLAWGSILGLVALAGAAVCLVAIGVPPSRERASARA